MYSNIERLIKKVIKEERQRLRELDSEDQIEYHATNLLDYCGGEVEDVPNWRANSDAVRYFQENGITDGSQASKIYYKAVAMSNENRPRPRSKNRKYLDN